MQCTQSYYKKLFRSYLKRPRIFSIFICTDFNIQIITIHLHLYELISFICTNTNNWIIVKTWAVNIIRKSHLMLLQFFYSLVLLYILRYTRMHQYITFRQEIPSYDFHYILCIHFSSARKHIFLYHSQKLHKFLKT